MTESTEVERGRGSLEVIGHAYGASDISLVVAAFDASNVPLFVLDAHANTVMTANTVALGGARLAVPRAVSAEAISLLQDIDRGRQAESLSLPVILFSVVALLLWGIPTPARGLFPVHTETGLVRAD